MMAGGEPPDRWTPRQVRCLGCTFSSCRPFGLHFRRSCDRPPAGEGVHGKAMFGMMTHAGQSGLEMTFPNPQERDSRHQGMSHRQRI